MVYEVEIEGTLPTLNDRKIAIRLDKENEYRAWRDGKIQEIVSCFANAPKFVGPVYVGVVWVRPDMFRNHRIVSYARSFIVCALRRAGVIRDEFFQFDDVINLDFFFNARDPRTVIRVADNLDELYAHQESRYA